jgi:hypothetical protein
MPLISSKRINKNNKNVVILKKNKSSRVPLGVLGAGAAALLIIKSSVPKFPWRSSLPTKLRRTSLAGDVFVSERNPGCALLKRSARAKLTATHRNCNCDCDSATAKEGRSTSRRGSAHGTHAHNTHDAAAVLLKRLPIDNCRVSKSLRVAVVKPLFLKK